MDLNNYKEVSPKKLSEKNKIIIAAFVIMVIIIGVMFLNSNKLRDKETNEANNNFKIQNPEVKIELVAVLIQISKDNQIQDFSSKTFHLQLAFALNEMHDCFMGIKRTRELFEAGFKAEALQEYATVMHCYLNKNIEGFLKNGSFPKFATSINIAHRNGLISTNQKEFLDTLRKLRNKKAHTPGVNFENEITELYLNSGLNLIETKIVC